jgi:crotonobetainyl-CoA:carnitine CoA-transferase CaiB-like acyl-CoA transferase
VPYECFATADGYIVLAVGNDEQWQRFCAAASRDDLGRDERFVSNPLRVANRGQLVAELRGLIGLRTTREWVDTLEPAQVPHAPVLGVNEAFAHPQVLAREMVVETDGGLKLVASPVRVQGGRSVPPVPPPQLGQHTDEILSDLGYTSEAIRVLHAQGVS